MTTELKPYPAMKDSGVPWLEEVPEQWECRRNGRLFVQRNETGFASLPILEVSLKTGVQIRNFDSSKRKQVMSDVEKYKRACKGDIAYNMMRMWQGAVGVTPADGLVSPAYIVARPLQDVDPRYYEYLFRIGLYMDQVNQFSRGIVSDRNRLYWEDFKQMPSPFPPVEEQAAIVRFLDHADRRIRRYIRAKQKLIQLLEEQKQAIILHAVTRGLDPNVRLKPSCVEWLGDVPEHWNEAIRVKYISSLKGRLGWQGLKASEYTTEGPYVVSSAHFRNHRVDWSLCPRVSQVRYEMDESIQLRQGDILLMKDGAAMGKLAYISELPANSCLNSHLLLFRPLEVNQCKTYDPQFMFYFMTTRVFQDYVQVNGTGATFSGISQESIGNYRICLPLIDEQRMIVAFLDAETSALRRAQATAIDEIGLLLEYSTRLTADVVTGKLDVREAAARLPDDAGEPEPLDQAESETDAEEQDAGDDVGELPEDVEA